MKYIYLPDSSALVTGLHRPKKIHAWTTSSMILWSNDATKKEWRAYKEQCWSLNVSLSIPLWYSYIQLFVWYFLWLNINQTAHKTVIKNENAPKNALIDRNVTSDRAENICELYGLHFAHCELLSKSVCACCDQTAFKFIDLQQQSIGWVLFVKFH